MPDDHHLGGLIYDFPLEFEEKQREKKQREEQKQREKTLKRSCLGRDR